MEKLELFDQIHGLSALRKFQFWGFWNRCFYCPERLVCYIKGRRSFFDDLFWRSITWEYRGLHGVTGGYKGLHEVTRGYRGLQGVTGGYKGLQGETKNYRNFFLTRSSQIVFLGWFSIKIEVEEILNFWAKWLTNPFWKILTLRFS